MDIPLSDGRIIWVDEKCKQFLVHSFQSMLFITNGYVFPKYTQTHSEIMKRVQHIEKNGIKLNSENLYKELVEYRDKKLSRN